MTLAQNIYESLLKDPDLEIGQNQTREEFAAQEANQRTRQHYNNVAALSLANAPLKEVYKSPLFNLINYVNRSLTTTLSIAKESVDVEMEKPTELPDENTAPSSTVVEDELIAVISDRDEEIQNLQAKILKLEQDVLDIKQEIAEEDQKQGIKYSLYKDANILPLLPRPKTGDPAEDPLEDGATRIYPKSIVTSYAMKLAKHQKQYKDYMSPKTQEDLIEALINARTMGADIDAVIEEAKFMGDDFGIAEKPESPKNPEEFVSKSIITT